MEIFAIAATGTDPAVLLIEFVVAALDIFCVPSAIFSFFFLLLFSIVSRIGLVVLIFYCFASILPAVYQSVNWVQFLLNFS